MADAGDRAALLSYQDDAELAQIDPHTVEASDEFNPARGRRQKFLSLFHKTGSFGAFIRLNLITTVTALVLIVLFGGFIAPFVSHHVNNRRELQCHTIELGYQCHKPYSQLWGQYSPFSSLKYKSSIPSDVPPGCTITFAQMLSRHGARHPTDSKTKLYAELIDRIQKTAKSYEAGCNFLETFKYPLKAEEMTPFGNIQLFNSGAKFYNRYRNLARHKSPFVRAAGSPRVIKSAERFIEGFQSFKVSDPDSTKELPVLSVIIPEGEGFNNTLDHGACTRFEEDESGEDIQKEFVKRFAPNIFDRVMRLLPGANITIMDIPSLMDLCSFHTVALTPDASDISPFCRIFTYGEWIDYDYYQSLGKYYKYGPGHPLGPEQGIGFTNELIARLTNTPCKDNTSTNQTLNADPATFPLNATLYADFSHDNTMISIFAALGLFNGTKALPVDRVQTPIESDGFSAAWTVPFAGRAYVEKMKCEWSPRKDDEYVRILLNDRVARLHGCQVDSFGRCELKDFVAGLSYAANGGNWKACFATKPAF